MIRPSERKTLTTRTESRRASQITKAKAAPRKTDEQKASISSRRLAAIRLADLASIGRIPAHYGKILDPVPWLKVLANILSSSPPGPLSGRVTRTGDMPSDWGLTYLNLSYAAKRCGVVASDDAIRLQVAETLAWRAKGAVRLQRPDYSPMRPDRIAEALGVTHELRERAMAWSIGTVGGSPAQRRRARKLKARLRSEANRRARGVKPRAKASRPWLETGISKTTFYRHKAEAGHENSQPIEVGHQSVKHQNSQPIEGCGTREFAANRRRDTAINVDLLSTVEARCEDCFSQERKFADAETSHDDGWQPVAAAKIVSWSRGAIPAWDGYAALPRDWRDNLEFA